MNAYDLDTKISLWSKQVAKKGISIPFNCLVCQHVVSVFSTDIFQHSVWDVHEYKMPVSVWTSLLPISQRNMHHYFPSMQIRNRVNKETISVFQILNKPSCKTCKNYQLFSPKKWIHVWCYVLKMGIILAVDVWLVGCQSDAWLAPVHGSGRTLLVNISINCHLAVCAAERIYYYSSKPFASPGHFLHFNKVLQSFE